MNLKFLRWARGETGRNFKFTALAWRPRKLHQRLRPLDLDLDERERAVRRVQDVMLDAGRALVGISGLVSRFRNLSVPLDLHDRVGEQHHEIGPTVRVPAGGRTR